jgi:3-beta hydroxysteroid dehydrogenase/isomerase family
LPLKLSLRLESGHLLHLGSLLLALESPQGEGGSFAGCLDFSQRSTLLLDSCGPVSVTSMSHESYLVVGGCGFLGRNIVDALLARGEREVAVFDLVQSYFDVNVQYFTGDITDETAVRHAIEKVR